MPYCDTHKAHQDHFGQLDARIGELETRDIEKTRLLARMDAILTQLQKLYWICVTAVMGCLTTAVFALVLK